MRVYTKLFLVLPAISLLITAVTAPGCGDTSSGTSASGGQADAAPDVEIKSNCGHPGDVGNSLGVGKFCLELTDCTENTKATLCTQIADPDNYFCTFACKGDGGADQCGENASCQCAGGGCGCFPDACFDDPPDGGASDASSE